MSKTTRSVSRSASPSRPAASGKKPTIAANGVPTGRVVPIRTVRISRPYGGEIVLEAPDVPTIGEYLDRTEAVPISGET